MKEGQTTAPDRIGTAGAAAIADRAGGRLGLQRGRGVHALGKARGGVATAGGSR